MAAELAGLKDVDTEPAQEVRRLGEGEAHDAPEAAFDARHENRRAALDSVGAGFVEGLAGRDIAPDFVFTDGPEPHPRARYHFLEAIRCRERDCRDHFMLAAREPLQHAHRIFAILGLADDALLADHRRIGSEHRPAWQRTPGHVARGQLGFRTGDAKSVRIGLFVGYRRFVNVDAALDIFAQQHYFESDTDLFQELTP